MAQAACWPVGPQGIGPLLRSGSLGPVSRGRLLLIDSLRRAEWLATHLGIRAVEVDAIDDDARRFYQRFGFTPLIDDAKHLFLPMHVVRKLQLRSGS